MSSGKGGKKTTTQTSKVKPPGYLREDAVFGEKEARRLYDAGAPAYYPDNMVAGFDPYQQEAMDKTVQMARAGSPLVDSAQGWAQNVLDTPAGSNPYIDDLLNNYARKANALVMSNFNKAGRIGSGSNAATAGTAITNATLPVLAEQYNKDRQLQYGVAGMAPGLAEQDYIDASRIGTVGDANQIMDQNVINADVNKYNYEANAPGQNLDQFLQRLYNNPDWRNTSTTNTQTQSGGGSGLGSILGTALSLGSAFFNPTGALAGMGSSLGLGGMLSQAGLANTAFGRGFGGFSGASTATSAGPINWLR